jgi:hypothetical protein
MRGRDIHVQNEVRHSHGNRGDFESSRRAERPESKQMAQGSCGVVAV